MKRLFTVVLLSCAALPAVDYLPLETGNTWTYRDQGGRDTFTISVGVPAVIGGQTYYAITGYVQERLWVRSTEEGLYYRDEQRNTEAVLTPFASSDQWLKAPFRPCDLEASASAGKQPYTGPVGRYGPGLVVQYRSFGCADVGVVKEEFLDNIGMARREVTTFAGPRVYELVHARVGGTILGEKPGAAFRVSVQQEAATRLAATLRLSVFGPPFKLLFMTSQEYDVQLRDAEGNVIYTWSADKAFLQAVHARDAQGELVWTVEIPLANTLKPGRYTVEGWLTSGPSRREFAAAMSFDVAAPIAAAASTAACGPGCGSTGRPNGRPR